MGARKRSTREIVEASRGLLQNHLGDLDDGPGEKSFRNRKIVMAYLNGATVPELARDNGLTRNRVAQIILKLVRQVNHPRFTRLYK